MGGTSKVGPGDCLPPNCPARGRTWNLRFQGAGCCRLHHKTIIFVARSTAVEHKPRLLEAGCRGYAPAVGVKPPHPLL